MGKKMKAFFEILEKTWRLGGLNYLIALVMIQKRH
jgi:hypothetical protein